MQNGERNRMIMFSGHRRRKKQPTFPTSLSGALGSNPVQNLVGLASTKSHPIFHCRKCVAIATRPSHLSFSYRACIFDLHHPLLPSASRSITPHLISPLWLAFFLSCPPSYRWPSQMDGRWIAMQRGGWGGGGGGAKRSPVARCKKEEGWKRELTCCLAGNKIAAAPEELDAKSIWK